jgi:hypothetical protein
MPVDTKITSHKMTRPDMAHVQVEWDSTTIFSIIASPHSSVRECAGISGGSPFSLFPDMRPGKMPALSAGQGPRRIYCRVGGMPDL